MIKNSAILLILIILLHSNCKKNNISACNCISIGSAPDKYIYPVKSGSAEWNAAGTAGGLDSIYKLCQVPQNLLQNMSTLGLIQTLETNPALFNMLLLDNKFSGRDKVLSRLNINLELNKRNDASEKIVDYYSQKNPCCAESIPNAIDKGKFVFNWYFFDMICTQNSLIEKLGLSSKKKFVKIILNKYQIQLKYPDTFGSSKTSSVLILSNILKASSYQPYLIALSTNESLNFFANTGIITSDTILNDIVNHAIKFANN